MALATWAQQLLLASLWVPEDTHCHQIMTQTHHKALGRASKKSKFRSFSSATEWPKKAPKAPTTQSPRELDADKKG